MESICNIYRIGTGPSSSHTMAPQRAARNFVAAYPGAARYRVTLFGSLAATGRGHLTDQALSQVIPPSQLELLWRPQEQLPRHPNGMRFEALDEEGALLANRDEYSSGGGALLSDQEGRPTELSRYPLTTMAAIISALEQSGESLWEFVINHEERPFLDYLDNVWDVMTSSIRNGLSHAGVLPGGLGLARKAADFYRKATLYSTHLQNNARLWSYALAVAEENASGGMIATAPTCGAGGVLPAVLRYLNETLACRYEDILHALATAGLIGNLVKQNASISGAEVGCQGEIGTACAMAAAAATQLQGGSIRQIEYAAEMGLEHHLGLTCDPVAGLVQIPCIERNAHAATRALSCCHFALLAGGEHKISFDEITAVMRETGHALPLLYRETSTGGIARAYQQRNGPAADQ
ncbi:L-serine ammonia-lyase, iron-sulfur-dependent, subunit alpha [Pelobacter seleniigenes]|uniref:L-serine ammonia-lyase, iron-sulfur-dependent, subunit alpha n=1 Tax=Pelobacter seleniigenes TaxID=407188 RepID=UPI0004A72B31|nr:L-serine ammonia-lyase, iron-sulfur-dependent, subunit alpha [Pelobacter seleniigenes]